MFRDQIKNLKLEQRVMSGVLHKIGGDYCFQSSGEGQNGMGNVLLNAGLEGGHGRSPFPNQ